MARRELGYVVLNQGYVSVNGRVLEHEATGNALLAELYRSHIADWPKFFKMDTLSKAGFVASELLFKESEPEPRRDPVADVAEGEGDTWRARPGPDPALRGPYRP